MRQPLVVETQACSDRLYRFAAEAPEVLPFAVAFFIFRQTPGVSLRKMRSISSGNPGHILLVFLQLWQCGRVSSHYFDRIVSNFLQQPSHSRTVRRKALIKVETAYFDSTILAILTTSRRFATVHHRRRKEKALARLKLRAGK